MLKHTQERTQLLHRIKHEVPRMSGVYLFLDKAGRILYIGKSVNLRHRILSYFQENRSRLEPRIQRMVSVIADFHFIGTTSELRALLLEDKLIKLKMPLYNVRQKEFYNYQYLLLSKGKFPRFVIGPEPDYQIYSCGFGPYKDTYFAESLLTIIQLAFKLRICKTQNPTKKCFQYDIGGCLGACRQKVSPAEYIEQIEKAIQFLHGDESETISRLEAVLTQKTAALEYEKAAELKEQINFCRMFCLRQRFISQFQNQNLMIYENGNTDVTHLFIKGFYKLLNGAVMPEEIKKYIRNFIAAKKLPPEDARFVVDRANIVYNWLQNNDTAQTFRFIPFDKQEIL